MAYKIEEFEKRELPEIICSRQIINKLKRKNLPEIVKNLFNKSYINSRENPIVSYEEFAYERIKLGRKIWYNKSRDWTNTIIKNEYLGRYLHRLEHTCQIKSTDVVFPEWSNKASGNLENPIFLVPDSNGLFLCTAKNKEFGGFNVTLYESNLKKPKSVYKIITLANFNLIEVISKH